MTDITQLAEAILVAMYANPNTKPEEVTHNATVAFGAANAFWQAAMQPQTEAAILSPEPDPPKATIRTVIWALNKLKAAPGQPNRDMVRRFLYFNNWIGPTDAPEDWNLYLVPITNEQLAALVEKVQQFEKQFEKAPTKPEPQPQ